MSQASLDVNLLFGLLALQNDLIDQGGLVGAFQAWSRDKGRGLAEILVYRGDLDADDRSAVDALVASYLRKHGGDPEKSLASIGAGSSALEQLAAAGETDLEATLARIVMASHRTEGRGDGERTALM